MAKAGRDLRAYRRAAERLKRLTNVCWICGQPIDLELPPSHRMAFTADHVAPLATGGDILGELRPAHRKCNSGRGTDDIAPKRNSRDW